MTVATEYLWRRLTRFCASLTSFESAPIEACGGCKGQVVGGLRDHLPQAVRSA